MNIITLDMVVADAWIHLNEEFREMWHELPTDIDCMVGHDFIRDVVLPYLKRLKLSETITMIIHMITLYLHEHDVSR